MSAGADRLVRDDAAARRLAQNEFELPIAVEAGAGTGKTAVLVARVVVWCLGRGWERAAVELGPDAPARDIAACTLEGVVAITFTEAAAGEMAGRVAGAMATVVGGAIPLGVDPELLPPLARERARLLAAATHRLEARTIHSYCASLLRRWPIEAGVAPGFEVDADGTLREAAAFEVVEQAMRSALADPPDPDWAFLAAGGAGPDRLVQAVAALAAAGAGEELDEDPFSPEAVASLRAEAVASVDGLLAVVGNRLDAVSRSATSADVALLRGVREVLAASSDAPWLGAARPFGRRGEAPRSRVEKWAKGDLTQGEARALEGVDPGLLRAAAARVAHNAADLESLEPELYRAAARVLGPLVSAARRRLVEQGVMGFDDLLRGAQGLLASHPEVAQEIRKDIRQLLVDEFQDTDGLQCDIVRRLGLEGEDRPGLFVVGDPKQSIYGWRSADLAAYEAFRSELERAGGRVVRLAVSFRSVPPVLAEVERTVAPVMQRRPGLQPEFQPLVASDERLLAGVFRDHARAPVEAWLTWPVDEGGGLRTDARAAERLEAEARALVADLLAVHNRHQVKWAKIAVLLRSTSDLDVYLEAMRAAGVPFAVTRERAYYRQREVVGAASLVRVLLDPSDGLAQLALLRSEAVAVPDAALLPLWRGGLPQLLAGSVRGDEEAAARLDALIAGVDVPREVPGLDRIDGWREVLRHGVSVLAVLHRELRDQPASVLVERARTLWPLELMASARYLGGFRVTRLERFWDDLEAILDAHGDQPASIARFLRRSVEEARESPVAPAPAVVEDAVQVMTIHGAKGLDFDHVYLMQLDKGSGGGRRTRRSGLLPSHGRRVVCLLGWPSPDYLAAEREREAVEECERVRLLYVAMTRARERLVLSGGWSEGPAAADPERARSLLDLARHRLPPDVAEALLADGVDAVEDEHGLRWRTVAGVIEEAGGEHPKRDPSPGLTEAVDAAALERGWERARQRMARAWSGTVSGEAHRLLEESAEEGPEPGQGPPAVLVRGEAGVAAAVGTAVHEAMEELSPEALHPGFEVRSLACARLAAAGLDESWLEPARERLESVLGGLDRGRCLRRWQFLAPSLVARELPLLIPPEGDEGPLGFVTGAVDLVAVDPGDGGLVVVDYKTDAVAPGAGVEERVARYRPQVAAYARALAQALNLERVPACELWFLTADEIVRFEG